MTGHFGGSAVSVLTGKGDGTFNARTALTVGSNPSVGHAGDINGDGYPDLVTANNGSSDWSFVPGMANGAFGAPLRLKADGSNTGSAVGDLNGDKLPDVMVAGYSSRTVLLFIQQCK